MQMSPRHCARDSLTLWGTRGPFFQPQSVPRTRGPYNNQDQDSHPCTWERLI